MRLQLTCLVGLLSVVAGLAVASSTTLEQKPQFWAVPACVKVARDEAPCQPTSQSLEISAARNEYEAAQLVLRSPVALEEVEVKLGELKGEGGASIAPQNTEVRAGCYVELPKANRTVVDPLAPLTSTTLAADTNLPIYFIVHVPKDAPAGRYEAPVTLSWTGGGGQTSLTLNVWDFTLPDTPSCTTAFGYQPNLIAIAHHVAEKGPKADELAIRYFETMLDYKISPYHVPVPPDSPQAEHYYGDPRLTSFVIPPTGTDEELSSRAALLKEKGWWKKGFFYPVDEPTTTAQFDQLHKAAERLRKLCGNVRITSPFYTRPEGAKDKTFLDFAGADVNVLCLTTQHYDQDTTVQALCHKAQKEGSELWWYVCCGPGEPYSNFFITMGALQHRMLFWQMKTRGVTGLLYWSATYWNPDPKMGTGADPWTDMATIKDINPGVYGDGSLFYPGSKVGVDGPVPSVRLLNIRDGIEDFDYLTLLEKRTDAQTAKQAAQRLVKSLTEYTSSPVELETVRRDIAQQIMKK